MLTILEAINLSTGYLGKKGVESARINSELLLSHILKCKRLDLYLSFDRPLQQKEVDQFRELMLRRSRREPIQYIIGSVEFYGLEFKVNPSVLIPRPETEILVETIMENVSETEAIKIIDIGTGSGIIPIVLSKNLPNIEITGIDVSDEALKIACKNAEINDVKSKVKFFKQDILNGYFLDDKFNLVVSNPPYISEEDYASLEPELKVYEPRNALTDNADGLRFYNAISSKAKEILLPAGKIFFEVGIGQSEKVKEILIKNNFTNVSCRKDYLNIERVVYGELI